MSDHEKTAWEKINLFLDIAAHNATRYPEVTNIVYELNDMLCSFAKPGMLEREKVQQVEKLLQKHMRELGDPKYAAPKI